MRAAIAVFGAAVLALTGCTFQANPVISASQLEKLAVQALAEQWDAEPTVDCGKENVDLLEGTAVDCVAHNPNSALDYPATVTITEVKGSKYSIDVALGAAISDDAPPSDAPTVRPQSLAELAAGALETDLGYRPSVDCGSEPIAIVLEGTIDCVATGNDGLEYPARIVVTDVTDTGYDIDVTMGATPLG